MIYVGTAEADMRSDIAHGNGVYKTTDGGAHWSFLGLADTRQIGRVLVNPKNPNIASIAALGHAYGPNSERGVFRSTDGGAHWSRVLFKDENTGAISEFSGVPVPGSVRADRTTAPPPLNSLKNLSDELGELQNTVDGADADPSPDARAAYITLSRALGSKLQQWQQLKTSDVVRFDRGAKGQ
jgi:hypothetical protein